MYVGKEGGEGVELFRLGILRCDASLHSFQDCVQREPSSFVQDAVQVAVFEMKKLNMIQVRKVGGQC